MTIRIPQPVWAPDPPGSPPPATPAPPAPPSQPSLMSQDPPPPPDPNAPPPAPIADAFPDNWRDMIHGNDDAMKTEAARYKTPQEMLKSLVETKKMVRAAPKDDPMPADDKPDDLKAWRERNGVPAEPTGYKVAEDVQKRLTDEDKPLMENFMQAAHKAGKPQAYIDFATSWYVDAMEQVATQEAANDKQDMQAAEDALRTDWGQSYRQNFDFAVNTAKQLLGSEHEGQSIFEARLPDGTKLGSIPGFIKGMLQVGMAIYGDGSLVGDEAVKGTQARIDELRQMMSTNIDEYYAKGFDKEYQKLVEARDKAAAVRRPTA